MILIAIGANLPHPVHGPPLSTCRAAVAALAERGLAGVQVSPWYQSAPVPASDQPWYVNGVARLTTELDPGGLLTLLHHVEADFGRARGVANAARVLDLDLLAYGELVSKPGDWPVLPHPRMAERAFVLLPLADLVPDWRHPVLGQSARELAAALPPDQAIRRLGEDG